MSLDSSKKKPGDIQPRQIRFVSSDGQPQTKRRRVIAACGTCRKRKIRCSGEQPVCKTCLDCGNKCLGYTEPLQTQPPGRSQPPSQTQNNPPPQTQPQSQSQPQSSHFRSQSQSHSQTQSAQVPQTSSAQRDAGKSGPHASPPLSFPGPPKNAGEKSPVNPYTEGPETKNPLVPPATPRKEKDGEAVPVASPASTRTSLSSNNRTHVPYFRYFGPTAIVPGFKQMVVRVRESRKSNPSMSTESISSLRSPTLDRGGGPSAARLADSYDSNSIPFYDPEDSLPNSALITHLCETFFTHLGCNFPFLQRDRFLRDLKDKLVDPILVDAVCALAARFSPHPLLSPLKAHAIANSSDPENEVKNSDHGQPFAHRAMCAVVDAFSCPTLSAVQACLLLAYEEFGSNHDSGLWMYLGISIRMAQDLGMQKLEGLKHKYGRIGLTPKSVSCGQSGKHDENQHEDVVASKELDEEGEDTGDVRAKERERIDTFWTIFFLDRVISSGTGRPVTLRDDDIEIFFPLQSESDVVNCWPAPFPPLIRIIHLYGRITDLLNAIKEVNHVTPETLKRLAGMESDLTGIYQRLSPKLHFNAVNFQNYVRAQQGTNFILLHFWFHTLIVLLHQPTLLHSFGGRIQQLFPNSRELSISSAKTIADILAFAELIDAKSFIGNPFTSQPIYIAACAFLMESAFYSCPSSTSGSPPTMPLSKNRSSGFTIQTPDAPSTGDRKSNAKHNLLASAAKDNYQRCYKALKALETYWEGTKYILTVLDQKAKGIWDPLLYTTEEMDSAVEIPPPTPFTPAAFKRPPTRPNSVDPAAAQHDDSSKNRPTSEAPGDGGASPKIDPSQAIGWALTGATNSSHPNLSFLYQLPPGQGNAMPTQQEFNSQYNQSTNYQNMPAPPSTTSHSTNPPYPQISNPYHSPMINVSSQSNPSQISGPPKYTPMASEAVSTSDANLLLGLGSPFQNSNSLSPGTRVKFEKDMASQQQSTNRPTSSYNYHSTSLGHHPNLSTTHHDQTLHDQHNMFNNNAGVNLQGPDMMIESQDIDMNALQNTNAFPFSFNGDIMPYLEYLPHDVLSYFGENQTYDPMMNDDDPNNPQQQQQQQQSTQQ